MDCDPLRIPKPLDPKSGTNVIKALSAIVGSMAGISKSKSIFNEAIGEWSNFGAALFFGFMGFMPEKSSTWQEYKQANAIEKMQDYLVCMTESMLSSAVMDLKDFWTEQHIAAFNAALKSTVEKVADSCEAHNCLNYTNVEPSKRNQAANVRCMVDYASKDCKDVTVWDPANPTPCATDRDRKVEGVCGVDKKCHVTDITIQSVIEQYKAAQRFLWDTPAIYHFNTFDNVWNAGAVAAYAKGATVFLALSQQLHLLGVADPSTSEFAVKKFAAKAAQWLEARTAWHVNFNTSMQTVVSSSSPVPPAGAAPLQVRWTCQDVYNNNTWLGCNSDYAMKKIEVNRTVALLPQNTLPGQGNRYMCVCDDVTSHDCHVGEIRRSYPYVLTTVQKVREQAAAALSAATQKAFTDSGVYDLIKSLRVIAAEGLPENSFRVLQTYYPLSKCSIKATPEGLEMARKLGFGS